MKRELWDRFASKLERVNEAPEPLRGAMQAALKPGDIIRLMILGPAFNSLGKNTIATLLAVLDEEWIVVSGMEPGRLRIDRARFEETLLAELTIVLLHGRLKFDYAANGKACPVIMDFNTVMEPLYREAARLVLDVIEGTADASPVADSGLNALLAGVPMKFCSAAHEFRPPSQPVLALHHWPPVIGKKRLWFQRELAPAAVLVLTERELILISEEKTRSWTRIGRTTKHGYVATCCPRSRLKSWRIEANEKMASLELKLSAHQGGETFQVEFPHEAEQKVAALLRR